jgi:hypothetical protein
MSEAATVEVGSVEADTKPSQLPEPTGYKILIALPEVDEKTDAYEDKKKFPNGAYCKEGDFVLMRSYSGTRFSIHGKEFRLINDDSVEAVIDDPRGIRKV